MSFPLMHSIRCTDGALRIKNKFLAALSPNAPARQYKVIWIGLLFWVSIRQSLRPPAPPFASSPWKEERKAMAKYQKNLQFSSSILNSIES